MTLIGFYIELIGEEISVAPFWTNLGFEWVVGNIYFSGLTGHSGMTDVASHTRATQILCPKIYLRYDICLITWPHIFYITLEYYHCNMKGRYNSRDVCRVDGKGTWSCDSFGHSEFKMHINHWSVHPMINYIFQCFYSNLCVEWINDKYKGVHSNPAYVWNSTINNVPISGA